MLIACAKCHRQYDTTDLAVGAKVRCLCGELLVVQEVQARDMEMLRCASCGGNLDRHEKNCGFCGSEVSLAERGYGGTCPECFARMAKGAQFCCTCGVAIKPLSRLQPLQDKECPRCEAGLAVQEFDGGSLVECTSCGGIWLEEEKFLQATTQADDGAVQRFVQGRSSANEDVSAWEETVRYLKCPTCTNLMHRKNFASCSGVIVDWCRGHGYWFDRHELEAVLAFVSRGGLDEARQRERQREEAAARMAKTQIVDMRSARRERGSVELFEDFDGVELLRNVGGFLKRLLS